MKSSASLFMLCGGPFSTHIFWPQANSTLRKNNSKYLLLEKMIRTISLRIFQKVIKKRENINMCVWGKTKLFIWFQFLRSQVKANNFVQLETQADEIAQQIQVKKDVIHFACERIHQYILLQLYYNAFSLFFWIG